jgi:hypothetical protein
VPVRIMTASGGPSTAEPHPALVHRCPGPRVPCLPCSSGEEVACCGPCGVWARCHSTSTGGEASKARPAGLRPARLPAGGGLEPGTWWLQGVPSVCYGVTTAVAAGQVGYRFRPAPAVRLVTAGG